MLKPLIILLPLTIALPVQADCNLATELVYRANELHLHQAPVTEEMALLTQAIETCPDNPHAHNNLANLLGDQKQYAEAIAHYRQALSLQPDLTAAWYGLGEIYTIQKLLPQALEAYLHACAADQDAKQRVKELLQDSSFAEAQTGEVLDPAALAILLDGQRRQAMADLIQTCQLDGKDANRRAVMETKLILRNLEFASGSAILAKTAVNERQLQAISTALNQLPADRPIKIDGHSDNRPFAGLSQAASDERNWLLSQHRADTIKAALIEQGVATTRLTAAGHGNSKPVSTIDQDRNRRVEIIVE